MRGECPRAAGRRRRSIVRASATAALIASGCGPSSTPGRLGVELAPPSGWTKSASTPTAPGAPVASWTGPSGASLAVLTSLPIPDPRADALAAETATRLANLPGVAVESAVAGTWSGLGAARVEVVGPGTGDALAPSGLGTPVAPSGRSLVPTRRVIVAFPRRADTLTLLWHYPESARDAVGPDVEATLRSARLTDAPRPSSSY